MIIRSKPLALLLAGAASFSVCAAETDLAAIVVTATRQPMRVSETLADITVIDHEAIEQSGQSTLTEVLARQPGLQMSANGGPGSSAAIYMRGAEARHTLVLIDGMRIRSATTGQAALENIPLNEIDRIEILRGPASALYGSDAIGGVIQIFTRRNEGPVRPDVFLGYGSYNTRQAEASIGGSENELSFGFRAGLYDTDGINSTNGKSPYFNPDKDGFRQKHLAGNLTYRIGASDELGASFLNSQGTNHYDDGPSSIDSHADTTLASYEIHLLSHLQPTWTSQLRIGGSTDDSHAFNSSGNTRYRTDQRLYQWQNDIRLPLGRALVALERSEDHVSGTTNYTINRRTVDSALMGWSGHLGRHDLQANLRRDDDSQFGGKNTWQAAYGYRLTDDWRTHVAAGTAFDAPTFNQLYYPGPYYTGNPSLKPEIARSMEAGVAYARANQSISLTLFRNRVRDLIVWGDSTAINVGRAKLEGMTLAYVGAWAGWQITASLDALSARDETTGKRLKRRANHQLQGSLTRDFGTLKLGAELADVGRRFDDVTNTSAKTMAGYSVVNFFARYRVDAAWSVEARANNIGNVKYETAWGFAMPGTNLFVGLRYAPK